MPALAIADGLRRRRPELDAVLVGAERGIEATLLPQRDFRFHLLPFEPIYRREWWRNLRWPLIALDLLRRLDRLFESERPVLVLGTGGYASGPTVWSAARRGLPTAIQEQNAFPGFATRRLSRRVRHVYLGLPEARGALTPGPHTEIFDTGNPITPPDRTRRQAALARFGLHDDRPVVLVTGGSQGAQAINEATAGWIESGGADRVVLLWATGRRTYQQFAHLSRPPAVQVFDFLDPMADAYSVASLVVARAGMMTGAELCAWGLPSILVPLPTAAADHQTRNAEALEAAGAARMLRQADLTPASLTRAVTDLLEHRSTRELMANRARERGRPQALDTILSHLLTLVGGR
jgi:UDP-N-acetylglucosamine--N-acetylmuramyl-(pentapeptide) pyrophosphoryl-undecaprenol N-acetylglucosamine transferase